MNSRRSLTILIAFLLVASILLVACERPLQPPTEEAYPAPTAAAPEETTGDADAPAGETGDTGEAPAEEAGEAPPPEDVGEAVAGEDTGEAPPPEDTGEAAAGEGTGEAPPPEDTGEAAAGEDTGEAPPPEDTGEAAAGEDAAGEEPAPLEGIAETVDEGETIFDIAAKYGASWVIVAEYNNIDDVSTLTVGSIIFIPDEETAAAIREEMAAQLEEEGVGVVEEETGDEEAAVEDEEAAAETGTGGVTEEDGTATGTTTETIYVVRPGDNLYRIGLMFGISWVQIAEANGLTNPNDIKAGQELKIPVYAPGPTPEFTHVVQRGDTLAKIGQRYGVSWRAIAQANHLRPPYIIYPGQTLIIPGQGNW